MKQNRVSLLMKRYLDALEAKKEAYFDADEIDDILELLEISDDYTHYEDILLLGLRLHPNSTELAIRKCHFFIYNEKYEEALRLIESITEPENIDVELLRLECYCLLNQYPRVVSYIERLSRENPDILEEIFEYLTPVISDLDLVEETFDFIKRGLHYFPDNLILKDELCLHLESIGNIEGAIEICNELIDKNPYSVDYWFMLGKLHSMSANYEKAIEAFDFALACDDSDVELKMLKAYCLFMNNHYEKAVEVYLEVIEEDNEFTIRIIPLLAECYIKLDKYEEAYRLLKDYILNQSTDKEEEVSGYINLIRCCMELGKETEATTLLNKALDLYPDNIRLLSILAIKYKEEGNDEKSNEVTERIFLLIDESEDEISETVENLFQTAQFFSIRNELEEALKYYLKIAELSPEMPLINMCIAMSYLSLGNNAKFVEYFRKTSPNELIDFAGTSGFSIEKLPENLEYKHIQPEDLTAEFLKSKELLN